MHQVYADGTMRRLAVRVLKEGIRVIENAGIRLESLPDTPVSLIRMMSRLPVWIGSLLLAANVKQTENELHAPTPLSAAIVEMVHQIERSGEFWTVEGSKRKIKNAGLSQ